MTIAAMLLLMQAVTASAAGEREVVVIGVSPDRYKAALADCIARGCPPKEEIARSLNYAESQLLAGDYAGSRTTLLKARGRNRRYAAMLPVDVSDLHHANARLANLNGWVDSGRIGMFDVVDALKAGLPDDNWRVMAARLLIGDEFAKDGRPYAALSHYRWVEKLSQKANMPLVVGMAKFRRAALLATIASIDQGARAQARRAADEILLSTDPDWAVFRNGVRLVPSYLAPKRERPGLIDQAIASLEPQAAEFVQLVYQPPIDMASVSEDAGAGEQVTQWADVAFRITPDGRVADVEIVRRSPRLPDHWLAPALVSLRGRRYAPLRLTGDKAGIPRLERYSVVSDVIPIKGTHIPVRASTRRIDIIDISTNPAVAAKR